MVLGIPPLLKEGPYILQPVLNSNPLPCIPQVYRLPVPHHLEEALPVHPFTGGEHDDQVWQAGAGHWQLFVTFVQYHHVPA